MHLIQNSDALRVVSLTLEQQSQILSFVVRRVVYDRI